MDTKKDTKQGTKTGIKTNKKENKTPFTVSCKFSLAKNGSFFWGPGLKALFELIEQTGSVKGACEEMGMSYSKAWKKIKEAEDALECEVVTRVQGGKGGGQAHLTPKGKWILDTYTAFVKKATEEAKTTFEEVFGENEETQENN